jgi:hypothetical protein
MTIFTRKIFRTSVIAMTALTICAGQPSEASMTEFKKCLIIFGSIGLIFGPIGVMAIRDQNIKITQAKQIVQNSPLASIASSAQSNEIGKFALYNGQVYWFDQNGSPAPMLDRSTSLIFLHLTNVNKLVLAKNATFMLLNDNSLDVLGVNGNLHQIASVAHGEETTDISIEGDRLIRSSGPKKYVSNFRVGPQGDRLRTFVGMATKGFRSHSHVAIENSDAPLFSESEKNSP